MDPNEHLMVMFYDILLLDDVVYMKELYDKRRRRLCSLAELIPARAEIGSREKINFASAQAAELVQKVFAQPIARANPTVQRVSTWSPPHQT